MRWLKNRSKQVALDTVGVLLIVSSFLLGGLPGPGGIPLLLAGLSLLAINHEWAKRLQQRVKEEGRRFLRKMFSEHPVVQIIYDTLALVLVLNGIYLLNIRTRALDLSIALFSILLGAGLFLGNRRRFTRWLTKFKRR